MTDTLSEAGNAAGLRDPDLLKVARTNIAPADAIAELRTTYPLAFESTAQLAAEFEMLDMAAVALLRPGLPPRQAMSVLKQEYPTAFKQPEPPFDARTASKAEAAAKWADMQRDEARRQYDARNAADLARITARHTAKP